MNTYKLGKKAPINKKSLSFGDFITLVPDSPLVDFAPNYVYPMDLNDTVGDCVVAGFDHARQIILGLLTGVQKNLTTEQIVEFYKTQNPNYPQEDNGMDIQTFLKYLQKNGYIAGFAKIDHTNQDVLKSAVYMGLAVLIGVQLQQAQQSQFPNTWEYVEGSPIEGGHCVTPVGYNNTPAIFDIITWGQLIGATNTFIENQIDEAWFILLQEHIDNPKFRTHWDLNAFAQAVSEITQGKIIIPVTQPS